MSGATYKKDLVVLTADQDIEYALRGLFTRSQSLGLRTFTHDFLRHPQRDPGCLCDAPNFLRLAVRDYAHAMVLFDREGCGQEKRSPTDLESEVERQLFNAGWHDRAVAVVLDPEIEAWVWSDSPHVADILGWDNSSLRVWLLGQNPALPVG